MNWAWRLPLKPSIKFVLLALADASDDVGYCWPSISTLAKKTCLDPRSVQRILNQLQAQGFLRVERRRRPDGSPTSNGYRLALEPPPGKMSPPTGTEPPPPGTVSPPGDTGVTLTIIEPPKEPKPPQPPPSTTTSSADGRAEAEGTESRSELIFPKTLADREVQLAREKLAALPSILAQDVLDELAGRLATHTIRGSPLSYLRALITRAQAGNFTPEAGVKVAQARERQPAPGALKQRDAPVRAPPRPVDPGEHLARIRQVLLTDGKRQPESQ